jgi:2-polyprenyl-6-methoxyphenol hydroxylase-like FAD-dependent oxidoreductase
MELSTHNPILIIGAGVGGLSIGTLLVKDGFKIRVAEQHLWNFGITY